MSEALQVSTDSSEIFFEEGIIGVPRARRFHLLERPGSPLRILRCLDINGFALSVVDPYLVDPQYSPVLGPRIADALGIMENDPILMLAVTTQEPDGPVANLRAPLVVNVSKRLGVQVILDGAAYSLRTPMRVAREVLTAGP